MDQKSLEEELRDAFDSVPSPRSPMSLNFLWKCLQVSPLARMTAAEAASHPWLSTSEKLLKAFRQLDSEVLADWCKEPQPRPMPWTIPSVLDNHAQVTGFSESLLLRDDESKDKTAITIVNDVSQPPQISGEHNETTKPATGNLATDPIDLVQKELLNSSSVTPKMKSGLEEAVELPWTGFISRNLTASKLPHNTRRAPRVRIRDSMLLPLTSLDRHLRPHPRTNQREDILEILRATEQPFLNEGISCPRAKRLIDRLHGS